MINRYRTYIQIEIDILAKNLAEAEAINKKIDVGYLRSEGPEVEWGSVFPPKKGSKRFVEPKLKRIYHG